MPKKSKSRSSKKDRSARKKSSSRSRRPSTKKKSAKQSKVTLADYDDVQQSLLKREESAQRAKERLLQNLI